MHLQKAVDPFDRFVRCIGLGPQTRLVRYDPTAPLHDRYTADAWRRSPPTRRRCSRDTTLHDQRVLRLGLQLVRGAAQGRRLAPDRLRQPVPRLAGDVAALPLPVAGEGEPPLVDLLRRDQAADARHLDWEPFYDDRRRATCRTASSSRAYARDRRASASTPTRFEEFCAKHLAHLDEVAWEFFGTTGRQGRGAPEGRRALPAHEVERSPSCSGSASRRGAPTAAPEPGRQTAVMKERRALALGARVEREVTLVRWGTFGQPVLLFPTAGGDAEEIERFHLIDALAPLLDAGAIKVYSCDSVAGRGCWSQRGRRRPATRCARTSSTSTCATRSCPRSAPTASRPTSRSGRPARRSARSTRSPWCAASPTCSARDRMSGTYDLRRFVERPDFTDDFWVSSPLHFVPDARRAAHLERLRTRFILLASGEGRAEDIGESWRIANVLGRRASRTGSTRGARVAPRLADLAHDAAAVPRRVRPKGAR